MTYIQEVAFYGCTNLTGVYITDLAKWCASETEPTTEGNCWHYVDGIPTPW